MNFDLKTALTSLAPTLATMIGGPFAGTAVTMLEGAFGLAPGSGTAGITSALQGGKLTPDVAAQIRKADQDAAAKMKELDVDLVKINADHETAEDTLAVTDVQDARKTAVGNEKIYDVALAVLASFLVAMIAVLWGCWELASGSVKITAEMAGIFAAVTGLVGSIVGYFASNAQTVINFLFGGSIGGRKNADAVAANAAQLGTALGKAANAP